MDNQAEQKEKKGFFSRLKQGLTKTKENLVSGFDNLLNGVAVMDDDFYEELEELLVMSDVGLPTTEKIIENLKKRIREEHVRDADRCRELLKESMKEQMRLGDNEYLFEEQPSVVLVVGVNGVGKTTSIGKIASQMRTGGRSVLLAAADTFRAGAIEQLAVWAERAKVPLIAQKEGADPAAVVFDACMAAKARKTDVLICDTAGRLHNKKNLMEELRKINRILDREMEGFYKETLIVLDATTGQNALSQARQFMEVTDVSGIILTKMDGTAKGGVAIAVQAELGLPVKYIGVGEKIDDLQKFDAGAFIEALFER